MGSHCQRQSSAIKNEEDATEQGSMSVGRYAANSSFVAEHLQPPLLRYLQQIVEDHCSASSFSLGSFELCATLGTGSFGTVRMIRMKNSSNRTPFALKISSKVKVAGEWGGSISNAARGIIRETSILKSVEHPFIVNILKVFHDERRIFILMEFVNGGEMHRLIQTNEGLNMQTVQFFSAEIILAMEHLHSKHVIYRDLKPENVLLDCAGHIKVIDFGLAKILTKDKNFMTNTCCGTLCYQAPEVLLNKDYSFGVDWWGVGTLIFEMVCAKAPFGKDDSFMIQQRILSTSIQWPGKGMSRPLRNFISKLLTQRVDKRLGCNGNMKKHQFFQNLDFNMVDKRGVRPPYQPQLNSNDDISSFPKYPESMQDTGPELSKKDKQAWNHELSGFLAI